MTQNVLLFLIPAAYLLGSIPFGLIVGLSKGVDPRKTGSGNIGATNVGRLLGAKYFAIVFMLDLCKGLTPMLLAAAALRGKVPTQSDYLLWLLIGFAAITGHMFSLFIKFKGGKGVATALGVSLGVFPFYTVPGLIAAVVFVIVFKISRIVSISSIIAAIVFPIAYLVTGLSLRWDVFHTQLPLLIFATLLAALIVYRHRGNIARLMAGTENKFVKTKENT